MNLRHLLVLAAVAVIVYLLGFDPVERISAFREDSSALASGEYQARIARQIRSETVTQPLAVVPGDDDLQRELAESRKKLLDERAAALEKHSSAILRGDVNTLKRQVLENARNAGGDPQVGQQ